MTHDDKFEDFVRSAVNELDRVPVVPRDEMWTRIESARRFQRPKKRVQPVWLAWGAALAAMLAIGIGLGRMSMRQPATRAAVQTQQPVVANAPTQNVANSPTRQAETTGNRANDNTYGANRMSPYRLVALQHLSRAEVLLTEVSNGTVDSEVTSWAKEMLANTRMLMASPAADDQRIEHLLQDLELILAQIAAATPAERNKAELNLIQHGIEQTNVLPRLRATVPANSAVAGT